jgi:hypothetical protein
VGEGRVEGLEGGNLATRDRGGLGVKNPKTELYELGLANE